MLLVILILMLSYGLGCFYYFHKKKRPISFLILVDVIFSLMIYKSLMATIAYNQIENSEDGFVIPYTLARLVMPDHSWNIQ